MPVKVIWDDEAKTCIRQIYSGDVTLQDYMMAADEVERMAKGVSYTVHSLMDRTGLVSTPPLVLPAVRYANNHVPPNLGLRVLIQAAPFTRVVIEIGRRIAPRLMQHIHFVDTLEEGRALITRYSEATLSIV